MDRYRDRRSPPPRHSYGRGPPPSGDSYVPAGRGPRPRSRSPPPYRRRSRSPPPRMNDRWTPRTRSPPPGRYGSRDGYAPRDGRARSPRSGYAGSDDRYRSAPRSPPRRRSRDGSPLGARARSPPPSTSRRGASPPPRDYDNSRRRRSVDTPDQGFDPPPRRPLPPNVNWCDPALTYALPLRSRQGSVHALARDGTDEHEVEHALTEYSYSPPRRQYSSPRDRSSYRPRSRSPPPRRDDTYSASASRRRRSPTPRSSGPNSANISRRSSPRPSDRRLLDLPDREANAVPPRSPRPASPRGQTQTLTEQQTDRSNPRPPRGPATTDDDNTRNRAPATPHAPPTGPSAATPAQPPTGPSNRPPSTPAHAPRGAPAYRGRGDFRRGSWSTSNPPSGPSGRGRGSSNNEPYDGRARAAPTPYRGPPTPSASTSRTTPLTRRFNVAAELASLPRIRDEGERLPPLVDEARAARLEDEAARLRRVIDEKHAIARRGLREYEALERASKAAAERSAAVEEELRALVGEGATGAAF